MTTERSITRQRVVIIGGGTGTYTLLRGLKKYHQVMDIAAIVTMADSGGSTGRLRDEFGYLPVGDVRQALAALAPDIDDREDVLRNLFLYRFDRGEGLSGHNFGNLFLTALTDMLGSEVAAIETAGRLLRIAGEVVPVTTDNVHLVATYQSGREVVGEHAIDESDEQWHDDRIVNLQLSDEARLYQRANDIIAQADVIVFGPGDLYTSILPNVLVTGMREALLHSRAKKVFVANLMARSGQTIGMHVNDYVDEIEKYSGVRPEFVIVPDEPLPSDLLDRYAIEERVHPVAWDPTTQSTTIIPRPVVSASLPLRHRTDTVARSFIRHDSDALAQVIYDITFDAPQ